MVHFHVEDKKKRERDKRTEERVETRGEEEREAFHFHTERVSDGPVEAMQNTAAGTMDCLCPELI